MGSSFHYFRSRSPAFSSLFKLKKFHPLVLLLTRSICTKIPPQTGNQKITFVAWRVQESALTRYFSFPLQSFYFPCTSKQARSYRRLIVLPLQALEECGKMPKSSPETSLRDQLFERLFAGIKIHFEFLISVCKESRAETKQEKIVY